MAAIKVSDDVYARLDKLRQTEKGEVSFNDVILYLLEKEKK